MNAISFRKPVLAVQWDRSTVDYVLAERKGGAVTVTASGSLAWNDEDGEASPGEAMNAELRRLGARRPAVVVALGRGHVDVIPLQLPPAGDEELPTLVANQVVRDAGELAEGGIVDFVALDTEEGEPREVFAFVVDAATIEQVFAESTKAAVKPTAIVYRPLASVTLLQRMVPSSRRIMILVTIHDREADISIVRHGRLLYTRTARLSETNNTGDIAAQLGMEVRRSLAAASLAVDGEQQHLYVFGALEESERLIQDLADELSLPASVLDPLKSAQIEGQPPERVGRISPLLGMVYEHFGNEHQLDFLHPKGPPPPPNYLRRGAFYAAAALVVVAIGLYALWDQKAKADAEIADLRDRVQTTDTRLDKVKQKQAVVDAIWRWETDNVNWLDEIFDLTRRLPNGRDAVIRRLSVKPGHADENEINLSVQVRDPDVVTQLGEQLRDEYHNVRTRKVSERSSSKDYPWQFETRITLRKRDTEEYRKSVPSRQPKGDIAASSMVTTETQ